MEDDYRSQPLSFDSERFVMHEVPDFASPEAKSMDSLYESFLAEVREGRWNFITEDCVSINYNTNGGDTSILVKFTDQNQHKHTVTLRLFEPEVYDDTIDKAVLLYDFEATFGEEVLSFQSYPEYLMVNLWEDGINGQLANCDESLVMEIPYSVENVDIAKKPFYIFLDKVVSELKPIEWFLSKEEIWPIRWTFDTMNGICLALRAEANNGRWEGVSPENFEFLYTKDWVGIFLRYGVEDLYSMQYRLSVGTNYPIYNEGKMQADYTIGHCSEDEREMKCVSFINRQFQKQAMTLLEIPFSYNADIQRTQHNEIIITFDAKDAFQKFCLMLDIMLPLHKKFTTTKQVISSEALKAIKGLSQAFDLQPCRKVEPYAFFADGHFLK